MNSTLLREGLSQIKKLFGIEALQDERRTMALFSDFVPSGRIERNALKHMYESGAMRILLSAVEGATNVDYAVLQSKDALKSNELMDEKIALQLVEDICAVLELELPNIKIEDTHKSRNDIKTSISPTINEPQKTPNEKEISEILKKYGIQSGQVTINQDENCDNSINVYSTESDNKDLSKKIAVIAICLIAIGTIIGLSIYSWQIGQWLVGIVLAIAIVGVTVATREDYEAYKTQICFVSCISIVNVILVWLFPTQYSTMALPISLGAVIALCFCTYDAYEDYYVGHIDYRKTALTMMSGNLAVAISVRGGFASIFLWICVYLLPAALIAICVTKIYKGKRRKDGTYYVNGDVGAVTLMLTTAVIIGIHILLVYLCPHFVHSLHAYPQLLEKELGAKKAICYCNEEIEVSQWMGDLIHTFSCEQYNFWKPLESITYEFDEKSHWNVCSCGVATGMFDIVGEHTFENDVCIVCGCDKNKIIYEERSALYHKADEYLANGNIGAAAIAFGKCGDYNDASSRSYELWSKLDKYLKPTVIVCNYNYIIWINQDGTVSESLPLFTEVSKWSNISAISVGMAIAGLKEDGTVVVTEDFEDTSYQEWSDIVSISVGSGFILGLKNDGTVLACGENDFGQCDVSTWTDIVSIQAVDDGSFGVKSDGSVMVAGEIATETNHLNNVRYICFSNEAFITNTGRVTIPWSTELNWLSEKYTDIENVVSDIWRHIVLLNSDGKIFCHHGSEYHDIIWDCETCSEINSWIGINQLAVLKNSICLIIGIRNDGSLIIAGENLLTSYGYELYDFSDVLVKVYQ